MIQTVSRVLHLVPGLNLRRCNDVFLIQKNQSSDFVVSQNILPLSRVKNSVLMRLEVAEGQSTMMLALMAWLLAGCLCSSCVFWLVCDVVIFRYWWK